MAKKQVSELGKTITEARESKGISQRQLAKLAEMDSAEVSRIENGKRQKPNVLFLKGIAESLDLSLVDLMKKAGYNEVNINWGRNRENARSMEDFRRIIKDYERFYFDVLEDIDIRKNKVRRCSGAIGTLIEKIEHPDFYPKEKITMESIVMELQKIREEIKPIIDGFDKSKYPKFDPVQWDL